MTSPTLVPGLPLDTRKCISTLTRIVRMDTRGSTVRHGQSGTPLRHSSANHRRSGCSVRPRSLRHTRSASTGPSPAQLDLLYNDVRCKHSSPGLPRALVTSSPTRSTREPTRHITATSRSLVLTPWYLTPTLVNADSLVSDANAG